MKKKKLNIPKIIFAVIVALLLVWFFNSWIIPAILALVKGILSLAELTSSLEMPYLYFAFIFWICAGYFVLNILLNYWIKVFNWILNMNFYIERGDKNGRKKSKR